MQKGLNTQLPQIPSTWNRSGVTLMPRNLLSITFAGHRTCRLNVVINTALTTGIVSYAATGNSLIGSHMRHIKSQELEDVNLSSRCDWIESVLCRPRTCVRGYHIPSLRDFVVCESRSDGMRSHRNAVSVEVSNRMVCRYVGSLPADLERHACRRVATGLNRSFANHGLASVAFTCHRFAILLSASRNATTGCSPGRQSGENVALNLPSREATA
ncbi:hypothetical protein Rcae01_00961 [Novipirellula caenicola]|uniref:Uncharacterized protein n=1 Tax=Novipirellula caenicola TaxID=1536901 RepID=A0ABP9VJY6_9BACT